ncbi:MAG: M48 family metalloprotease [Gammaproteobacteria bacterium]|nr:M48 family metalloprotease [Gammaproteobacteria bacterium]
MLLRSHAIALAAAISAGLMLPGCASNPATGGIDIVLMSESKEISIGREMHEKMMESGAAYPDQRVQAYVDRIGQALAAHSDRPKLKYTFTVIDSENINAFALPGGYIYINRGLMSYLDNEAELAAVLSHEIGHVTARHSVRQQTASQVSSILAQLAYVTTGSADLADASNMAGTAIVRGYGREHELEADSEGAVYLYNTGYDPNALLAVIGVLKDQEQYNRIKAKESGKKSQSYHGLFATHPRNDSRLQQVIRTASELEERPPTLIEPAEFRGIINGLAYGKSSKTAVREDDRFYHNKLNFTFAHPEDWTVDSGSGAIVSHPADGSSTVNLTIKRKDDKLSARDFIGQQLQAPKLFEPATLNQAKLTGYTGIAPPGDGKNSRRLAVIYYGRIAYLFEGEVTEEANFAAEDAKFMALIESFRPMEKKEREGAKPQELAYIQTTPGMTYASLARQSKLRDAENQLRLMNGHYPRGEPHAGDWVKIVKQGS